MEQWKQKGYSKKYYYDEYSQHPNIWRRYISVGKAIEITEELSRVFNLDLTGIRANDKLKTSGGRFMGNNLGNIRKIEYKPSETLNLLTVLHEVAHALEFKLHGKTKHSNRLHRIVNKLVVYAQAQDYWGCTKAKPNVAVAASKDPNKEVKQLIDKNKGGKK